MDSREKVFRAHRALAFFYALLGLVFVAIAFLSTTREELGLVVVFLFIFGGIALVHFLTARACKEGKEGGRIASIAISCLMLLGFPLGTLIGIYLLANTWRPWAIE